MVTLTEKEARIVDEAYRYFVEQIHTPTRSEMYTWTIVRMKKYMMIDWPMTDEQMRVLDAIVASLPWEEETKERSNPWEKEPKDGNAG
tara:strand:+ start:20 stop:283 length:264 start_codon:yes stop_codon:yes gene_type:complete